MKLYLDRKDIEQILLVHANRIVPESGFNTVDWDGYSSVRGATLEHSDIPQEEENE